MKFIKMATRMILFFALCKVTVFAGSINEYEQHIIDTVSTPVTYNGKEYVAKEQYVTRLMAYLNQDNVDLTKEQADKAIEKFFDNIELGIKEGYMEEVKEEPKEDTTKEDTSQPEKDKDIGNEEGTGINDKTSNTGGTTGHKMENKNESNDSSKEESDEINKTEGAEVDNDTVQSPVKKEEAQSTELSTAELAKLQQEKEKVDALREKYSLLEEETDAYGELEKLEDSTKEAKDYFDAEPFQKGISLGTLAIIIVIVVGISMTCIVLLHKSRIYNRK